MPYNPNFTPDAPLPISMVPRAEKLTRDDLLLITQLGNIQGQRTKSATIENLFKSEAAKFVQPAVTLSNILEFTGSLPQFTGSSPSFTEIAKLEVDPRSSVEFHVWGTSNLATESSAGNNYAYGLTAKVRQMYLSDDQDRDLMSTIYTGSQFKVDGNTYGVNYPTYNGYFEPIPFDYNPSAGQLLNYPTKTVTLYLASGASPNPYQANPPQNFSLKIQAKVYPYKYVSDLLVP